MGDSMGTTRLASESANKGCYVGTSLAPRNNTIMPHSHDEMTSASASHYPHLSSEAFPTERARMTTRNIQREEERLSRDKDIKKRLAPIVLRLKACLGSIDLLEESIEQSVTADAESSSPASSEPPVVRYAKSRQLMHASMDLVKKKLLRLKQMEEMLASSEERRHDLQLYLLQVSLSKPHLELSSTKHKNDQLNKRVKELERTVAASNNDDAPNCFDQDCVQLQRHLQQVYVERDKLLKDLLQRQEKINEQAIQCDELECQVEHMKIVCDELIESLRRQEDRCSCLEQELLETRMYARRKTFQHPQTILLQERVASKTTDATMSSMTLTLSSLIRGEDNSFDSSSTLGSVSNQSLQRSLDKDRGRHHRPRGVSRPRKLFMSDVQDGQAAMIDTLIATIETLDEENAELWEEKHQFHGKLNAREKEFKNQRGNMERGDQELMSESAAIESKTAEWPTAREPIQE